MRGRRHDAIVRESGRADRCDQGTNRARRAAAGYGRLSNMSRPIFEVIATSAPDAVAAAAGGADRLELVTDMAADGLTPSVEEFARIRAAVHIPLRVMLRDRDGFLPRDLEALTATAEALRAEGAEEFVLGFLTSEGAVDLEAVRAVLAAIPGCRWTFHRALDNAADRDAVRAAIDGLPGLDTVL